MKYKSYKITIHYNGTDSSMIVGARNKKEALDKVKDVIINSSLYDCSISKLSFSVERYYYEHNNPYGE